MRLVALAESESHVCCRYRVAAFRPALAAAGHTLDIRAIPKSLFGRFAIGRDLTSYDAVILQRKLLPRWIIALLRRRVRRLIFDFDDAVWLRDSYAAKGFVDAKRAARFRTTIAACDLVIVGNEYLAAEARKYALAERVRVIPTCVDVASSVCFAAWAMAFVSWVGSSAHSRTRAPPMLPRWQAVRARARLSATGSRASDLTVERCV